MTKSNHCKSLLIDCGNSYLKMAIYCDDIEQDFVQIPAQSNILDGLSQFKDTSNIDKVFILATGKIEKQLLILKAKFAKANFKVINADDFSNLIDLSNVDKEVIIGNDIMLLKYWASKQKDVKAVVCLGSVYFALISENKQFKSVLLMPSLVKGLEQVEHISSIPSQLIPTKFDKVVGLNTPDAFAGGLNLEMSGFIKQLLETYKLNKNQLVITGGDCTKYKSLQEYKIIEHLTIKALSLLVKEKHW